jgi:CheY-like chemotaxis protein
MADARIQPLRVLVVDDDPLARAAVRRAVSHLAHVAVQDFASGLDALAACASTRFDVAVFDLEMPAIDGVTLAHRVRVLFPSIRLVFMSSDLEGPLAPSARALGPLLPKPWPHAEMLRLVLG